METLPLAGCVVVVTAERAAPRLTAPLERAGASVVVAPSLSTVPHLGDDSLIAATVSLIAAPPDVVVATTGTGFAGWIEAADAAGIGGALRDALRGATLVARGSRARRAIVAAGLDPAWSADSGTAAQVRDHLLATGVTGARVAVQHHGDTSDGLDEALEQAGARVTSVVVFGWRPPRDAQLHLDWLDHVAAGRADAVAFASAPEAHAWVDTAKERGILEPIATRAARGSLLLAAIGPVTASALETHGLVVVYPSTWSLGALVGRVVDHFSDASAGIPTTEGRLLMRATTAVLDGRVLPLTPTCLDILRVLAQASGNVVTREKVAELLPRQRSTGHAVDAAINRLRDDVGSRTLVRTVVKRGYALAVTAA